MNIFILHSILERMFARHFTHLRLQGIIKFTSDLWFVTTALPVITRHPNDKGNITVAEGSNVMLRCEATGNGTLIYQWRRVSGSLPYSARRRNNGQTLAFHNIAVPDSGEYYCVVSDTEGSMSSMRVQVTVKCKLINH